MLDENMEKFPQFMQDHFCKYNLTFPQGTRWTYDNILAYRAVKYNENKTKVEREDFLSKAEERTKGIITPRGAKAKWDDPVFYGVSLNRNKRNLVNLFKLPKPNKRLAQGVIDANGGPIFIQGDKGHVTWWLYDGSFELIRRSFEIKQYEGCDENE